MTFVPFKENDIGATLLFLLVRLRGEKWSHGGLKSETTTVCWWTKVIGVMKTSEVLWKLKVSCWQQIQLPGVAKKWLAF